MKHVWRKELTKAAAKKLGYHFDPLAAGEAVRFYEIVLRHTKGRWAGEPFKLLDWQRGIVQAIHGWKRANGTRRFRRGSIWVPKKNGKSTLMAGESLYLLVGDGEPGAEVYSAAVDREQAGIIYREAAAMVTKSMALAKRIKRVDSTKRLVVTGENAFFHSMSHEAPTKEGLNASGVIVDELHAHPNRELFDTLFYSGAARTQPLFLSISTAGVYDPEAVGWKEIEYARRVAKDPAVDPEYFAFVAEADAEDDWESPATWAKANPSLGETITVEDMAAEVRRVKEQPDMLPAFLRYRLNIWTQAETAWMDAATWAKCKGPERELAGLRHWGGLDLASTTDLAAWGRAWPLEDGRFAVRVHCFAPENDVLKRERRDRVPYVRWAREGWLTLTPGDVTDYEFIRRAVLEDAAAGGLADVGFDPWNAMHLATGLMGEGVEMIELRQGYRTMSEPMKTLMRLAIEGKLEHDGNPLLAWMIGNVVARTDANGNIAPAKDKSRGRIDGPVAAIMALARALDGMTESSVITHITM